MRFVNAVSIRTITIAGFILAAVFLAPRVSASPLPDTAFATKVERLMHWIADRTDLEVPDRQPAFLFLPADMINYVALGSRYAGSNPIVAEFSPTDAGIIFLPAEGYTDDVLLHELVHFMQMTNGRHVSCVGMLEREAYRLQDQFTAETGIGKPLTAFTILATSCPPPWE